MERKKEREREKKLIACQKQQFFSRFVFGSFDHKTNKKSTYILWPKTIEKKKSKKKEEKLKRIQSKKMDPHFFLLLINLCVCVGEKQGIIILCLVSSGGNVILTWWYWCWKKNFNRFFATIFTQRIFIFVIFIFRSFNQWNSHYILINDLFESDGFLTDFLLIF